MLTILKNLYVACILPVYISSYSCLLALSLFKIKIVDKIFHSFWFSTNVTLLNILFVKRLVIHYNPSLLNKKKLLLVSNHVNSLDWIILLIVLFTLKRHKIIFSAKKSLMMMSYALKRANRNMLDFIFLNRKLNFDYITLVDACYKLSKLDTYTAIIFPEGTLFTRKRTPLINIQRSSKINAPTPKNVTLPKTTGTEILLENLNNDLDGIINCTLMYSEKNLGLWTILCGKRATVHVCLDYEQVPNPNDKPYKQWVLDTFSTKDKLMDRWPHELEQDKRFLTIAFDMKKFLKKLVFIFPYYSRKIRRDFKCVFQNEFDI